MIKHLVFFKFNAGTGEDEITALVEEMNALPAKIGDVRAFETGRDVIRSERSFDLALIADFDDLDALDRYQVHPDHQAVVAKVKQLCAKVVAVDYDF